MLEGSGAGDAKIFSVFDGNVFSERYFSFQAIITLPFVYLYSRTVVNLKQSYLRRHKTVV